MNICRRRQKIEPWFSSLKTSSSFGAVDALGDAGFETLEASSADEAVAILSQHADIDVVFTDVHMPGSLDGLDLTHKIRLEWPTIGVIIASGWARFSQASLPGQTLFLEKPYEYSRIIGAVRQLARP